MEMSNAVFFVRDQMHERLDAESEIRYGEEISYGEEGSTGLQN